MWLKMAPSSALEWHILVVFGIKFPVFLYDSSWQVVETKMVGRIAIPAPAGNIFTAFFPFKHPAGRRFPRLKPTSILPALRGG
jgi:hypothetical protein